MFWVGVWLCPLGTKLGRVVPQLAKILVVEIAVIRLVTFIIVVSPFKLQPGWKGPGLGLQTPQFVVSSTF